jgi:hypothetical protein
MLHCAGLVERMPFARFTACPDQVLGEIATMAVSFAGEVQADSAFRMD